MLAMISHAARQFHYSWVEYAFAPQLEGVRGKARTRRRAALIAICDLQTWWILSHDLGLPRAEVRTILIDLVTRLVEEER